MDQASRGPAQPLELPSEALAVSALPNVRHEDGWHPGTERVEAVLVFDVSHFDPGATLGIKDLVVQ